VGERHSPETVWKGVPNERDLLLPPDVERRRLFGADGAVQVDSGFTMCDDSHIEPFLEVFDVWWSSWV
jgi:hypothetical protein